MNKKYLTISKRKTFKSNLYVANLSLFVVVNQDLFVIHPKLSTKTTTPL